MLLTLNIILSIIGAIVMFYSLFMINKYNVQSCKVMEIYNYTCNNDINIMSMLVNINSNVEIAYGSCKIAYEIASSYNCYTIGDNDIYIIKFIDQNKLSNLAIANIVVLIVTAFSYIYVKRRNLEYKNRIFSVVILSVVLVLSGLALSSYSLYYVKQHNMVECRIKQSINSICNNYNYLIELIVNIDNYVEIAYAPCQKQYNSTDIYHCYLIDNSYLLIDRDISNINIILILLSVQIAIYVTTVLTTIVSYYNHRRKYPTLL